MRVTTNLIRFLSCLYEPFLPSLSAKINFLLNLDQRTERDENLLEYLHNGKSYLALLTLIPDNHIIRQPVVLFSERIIIYFILFLNNFFFFKLMMLLWKDIN